MSISSTKQRDRFINLLRDLFQLNQPDLDFGLYRIMHAKSVELEKFLSEDLLAIIANTFEGNANDSIEAAKVNLEKELATAKEYGVVDPENSPKVMQARAAYEVARNSAGDDAEIYDHLYRFFERYYDQGDFLSRRYYARETHERAAPYSVPYDGSEVYLHWANKDQYYIKSSTNFRNFTVDLDQARDSEKQSALFGQEDTNFNLPRKLHLRLVDAVESEHNNVKASGEKDRFFLIDATPYEWTMDATGNIPELVCRFQYRVDSEKTGNANTWRDKRNLQAVDAIISALKEEADGDGSYAKHAKHFLQALQHPVSKGARKAGGKQETQPLLARYVAHYTGSNTMDYFIHKNLGDFLKRELDFYIKNEVMRLDDLGTVNEPQVADYQKFLKKLHTLRSIAQQLITFLAQIEDFQKKLWLKKKFVIDTQWLITLDKVPAELYPQIVSNVKQWDQWKELGFLNFDEQSEDLISPAVCRTVEYLQSNTALVLDTQNFDTKTYPGFTEQLLASINNLDEATDGVLIHSENFQALNLMQERYRKQVKCIYIDPPYNTGSDGFAYKDSYQRSSWLSMMSSRLQIGERLLKDDGVYFASIDDREINNLCALFDCDLPGYSKKIICVKMSEPTGRKMASVINFGSIAKLKEFVVTARKGGIKNYALEKIPKTEWDDEYKTLVLGISKSELSEVKAILNKETVDDFDIDVLDNYLKKARFSSFHEFSRDNNVVIDTQWKFENAYRIVQIASLTGGAKSIADEKKRVSSSPAFAIKTPRLRAYCIKADYDIGVETPRIKLLFADEYLTTHPGDFWSDIKTTGLDNEGYVEFLNGKKPKKLISRLLGSVVDQDEVVLDFFAGSGTTGEVCLDLGLKIQEKIKFVLVEMGLHFDEKLVPRLKKSFFCKKYSGVIKRIRLESYEDTLNNLKLTEDSPRKAISIANPQIRTDYYLQYLLNLETQASPSLLNIATFSDPTAYQLEVKRPESDAHELRSLDLVESFNWLIGLRVDKLHVSQNFTANFMREPDPDLPLDSATRLVLNGKLQVCTSSDEVPHWWFRSVEGRVPAAVGSLIEQNVLIVWRKLSGDLEQDNVVLEAYLHEILHIDLSNSDDKNLYDVIYVNGSHSLPKLAHCDIRLIEETFHQRMWESQDV